MLMYMFNRAVSFLSNIELLLFFSVCYVVEQSKQQSNFKKKIYRFCCEEKRCVPISRGHWCGHILSDSVRESYAVDQ